MHPHPFDTATARKKHFLTTEPMAIFKIKKRTCCSLTESRKQSVRALTWFDFSWPIDRASMACARNLLTRLVGWCCWKLAWRFLRGRFDLSVTLFCQGENAIKLIVQKRRFKNKKPFCVQEPWAGPDWGSVRLGVRASEPTRPGRCWRTAPPPNT